MEVHSFQAYDDLPKFLKLTQAERDRQMEEALNVDRPFSDLPFILEANYFRDEGSSSIVPVSLQLAGDGVQFEVKGERREAQFEFLGRVTDPKGHVAGVARDTVQVRLPVVKAEKIKGGQILFNTGFQLHPGSYNLKFLIRDNRITPNDVGQGGVIDVSNGHRTIDVSIIRNRIAGASYNSGVFLYQYADGSITATVAGNEITGQDTGTT